MNNKRNDGLIVAGIGVGLFAIGALVGYLSKQYLVERKTVDADLVLNNVKDDFKDTGDIEGAWIELNPVEHEIFPHKTDVFKGGISRIEDDNLVQYEFIADAHTGTIMDISTIETY